MLLITIYRTTKAALDGSHIQKTEDVTAAQNVLMCSVDVFCVL